MLQRTAALPVLVASFRIQDICSLETDKPWEGSSGIPQDSARGSRGAEERQGPAEWDSHHEGATKRLRVVERGLTGSVGTSGLPRSPRLPGDVSLPEPTVDPFLS